MVDSCRIRAVTDADLPILLSWRNHDDVRRFMFNQHEISFEEHRNWFTKASADVTCRLLIVEDALVPLGYVQLSHVEPAYVADWGFYVRPDAPKGSGRNLGQIALNYAFGELKLHKVCGQVIESNVDSIAFHRRLGFAQEGVLRDQKRINGVYHNLICFGLLADEWQAELDVLEAVNGKD